jgi:WD40 repeat protein
VATASENEVMIKSLRDGKLLGVSLPHNDVVTHLIFSPDGNILATASGDNMARLWEVSTCKVLGEPLQLKGEPVVALAFSSDSATLATSTGENVQLWDVVTRKPLGEPLLHQPWALAIAFSTDGKHLFSASDDSIRRWKSPAEPLEPAAYLLLWAETLVGAEVDEGSGVRVLQAGEQLKKHDQLHRAGGAPKSWRKAVDREK